jgi:hypothetical protein
MSTAHNNKLALLIAFLVGLSLFILLNFTPSGDGGEYGTPDAALTTRGEAERAAVTFAEWLIGSGDWKAFAMYDANSPATGYLSKELPEADPAQVWPMAPFEYFRVEVMDAEGASRLVVYVATEEARVIGWDTWFSEDTEAQVYGSAESAIAALGYNPDEFEAEIWDDETVWFTHREQIGELLYRLEVFMSGDRVMSVVPYVEAPWSIVSLLEEYELTGTLVSMSSLAAIFLLGIAAVVLAAVFRKDMAFGRGIWLTLAYFIPIAVYTAGLYPALRIEMPFEWGGALFAVLFQLFVYMLEAAVIWLSLVAGEGLWRRMGFRLWPPMRDDSFARESMRSVWVGYAYAGIILGVQAVVLSIGYWKFGVWQSADPLIDIRNQLFPGFYPLLAWAAAISEEAIYRLFAIAAFTMPLRQFWRFVHRLTGKPIFLNPLFSIVPAILLASALWGAAHVGYAVYPVYTRLIEVTILGLVFSWLFLRHGLMAAIFAHAAVDLLWMSIDLWMNGVHGWLFGLMYMATPIAAAYIAALLSGRMRSRGNAAVPHEP